MQLTVKGKNFYRWIVVSSWRVLWSFGISRECHWISTILIGNNFSAHCKLKKCCHEKWCCGFALKRSVTVVSSFTVLVIVKFKCMKTQSVQQRKVCDQDLKRVFNIWRLFKKTEQTKETGLLASVNWFPIRVSTTPHLATTSFKDMVGPVGCPLLTKLLNHHWSITTIKYK